MRVKQQLELKSQSVPCGCYVTVDSKEFAVVAMVILCGC